MIRRALLLALLAAPALAHDHAFTAAENAWLNRQYALDGMKCCDETDAHVGHHVEWRLIGGQYEILIAGRWVAVPAGRVMRHNPADPTPWPGQAIAFFQVGPGELVRLYCFFPEPLT